MKNDDGFMYGKFSYWGDKELFLQNEKEYVTSDLKILTTQQP